MVEMPQLPNDEKQAELRALIEQVKTHFKKLKVGEAIKKDELALFLGTDLQLLVTAINVLRMQGELIIEDSRGMFLAKNKEQYDIWWNLYMKPAMQTLIAMQRAMSPNVQKLPRLLKAVNNEKVKT